MQQEGWDVITAAPIDDYAEVLRQKNIPFFPILMQNMGTNPLEDLKLWFVYWKLIKRERPDVLLSFTVKPNIYGGLAARILGIPYFPNVAGLGTAFIRTSWITWIVKHLYRFMLNRANTVFFKIATIKTYLSNKAWLHQQRLKFCLVPALIPKDFSSTKFAIREIYLSFAISYFGTRVLENL